MSINVNFAVDKEYEDKSLKEIAGAPVQALQGVSDRMAIALNEVGIHTVADLANWKYIKWAEAITVLAGLEE